MKIKQQKQIKTFLIEQYGEEKGKKVFDKQEIKLNELIQNIKNKSKNQRKTLIQIILPRIALYKALTEECFEEDNVYECMRKYMIDVVAKEKHLSMVKMEKIPGFYSIYSSVFLRVVRTTDLWKSVQNHGKDYFDVTYGGLKKLGFSRTKTLGYGKECCEFHFYKKYNNIKGLTIVLFRTKMKSTE